MTADQLSARALNRATLDRQLLLRRDARPARQAIEHLTALQAQAPLAPYVGLWTRLSGFRHQHLQDLLTERSVVRAHLLRNTIHLLTAEDFLFFPGSVPAAEGSRAGRELRPAPHRSRPGRAAARGDVASEGSRLLEFAAPAAAHDVRVLAAGNDTDAHDRSGS